MTTPSLAGYFAVMARNNAWSNHRLLSALAHLSQAELEAPRVGFFPSLQRTLNHILIVDWYYLDALERGGRGLALVADEVPCPTLPALRSAQTGADRRLLDFCARLQPRQLGDEVVLERDHGMVRDRVDRALAHLFTHQIHHRGQAHAMLSGTQVAPPQLDEFLLGSDAPLRAADLDALGFDEADTWMR
jgi:uncharacterized damage-inducible protein DinB